MGWAGLALMDGSDAVNGVDCIAHGWLDGLNGWRGWHGHEWHGHEWHELRGMNPMA